MSLEDAILQDIIENPADDAARLIYADWLEDQNEPGARDLAEFIRLQIELEKVCEEGPQLWAMRQREKDLLRTYRADWARPLTDLVWGEEFRRGFVDAVRMSAAHFLQRGAEVFALAPIQRLRLVASFLVGQTQIDYVQLLRDIGRSPLLSRLAALRLELPLTAPALRELLRSAYLGQLRELDLRTFTLNEPTVETLLDWPGCARLRTLTLRYRQEEPGVVACLGRAAPFTALEELSIHAARLSRVDLEALARSRAFPRLRKLDLGHNLISNEGLSALMAGPLLGQIEELNLAGNRIGDDSAWIWPDEPPPTRLRFLDLSYNRMFGRDVSVLVAASSLSLLTGLNLRGNVIGGEGLSLLAGSRALAQLRMLLLHFNGIDDRGVEALAVAESLSHLIWLDLAANRITDTGARALIRSHHLGNLARLELQRNDISSTQHQNLINRFGQAVLL